MKKRSLKKSPTIASSVSYGMVLIAYSYSANGSSRGYAHKFARWNGITWTNQIIAETVVPGYKPRMSSTGNQINYYCGMGTSDLFVRGSKDNGNSWSSAQRLTTGKRVRRPIGTSANERDYLYLPCDLNPDKLFLGIVDKCVH